MHFITEDLLQSQNVYPENVIYNQKYGGMGNSTSIYKAPLFVTKGHYGHIDESIKFVPEVIDAKTKKQVVFKEEIDDVGMWVEPTTGTALEANQ